MGATPAALVRRPGWRHIWCVVTTMICDVYRSAENAKLKSSILVTAVGRHDRALPKSANVDFTVSEAARFATLTLITLAM